LEVIPPDRRTRNKVLIVCHGFEEIFDGDYCVDFNYSVTSDVLLPLIQKYVKNVKVVPNCVEPALYTHVERCGELKVVGWAGASWVWYKRFKMFQPIVDGAGLLGKVTDPVIPVDKMDEWYQDVDILLVLSGPEEFKETGPLPPFEAIVRGIPVIGTAVGNFKHIPGPKFETIEEGVRILTELKHDPARLRKLASDQLECVLANWTYSVVAHKWEDAMFAPMRRKVLIFSEVGFGKLYREVLQRISRCDVVYYNAARFVMHKFLYDLQQSDACIVPIHLYGDIQHFVEDKSLLSKFLFVAHDSSHIHALEYSLDAKYAVVSDSILHKMQDRVVNVIPMGIDPSLYTYRRRSGMLNIVGWSSGRSIKRFEMFYPIVEGVNLAGKATSGCIIPLDKTNEWYQNVDILLVLSSGPEESVETGPLSAFEAIACGIPVVGTAVGDFRHIPGPKFSTVEEGIALLEQLKRDPERVRDIAKQQYEALMSRWSYDVTAKLWEEALFSAAGKNELDGNA
jgi:glycosyltransferase involved in cell wall biosynthesis